MSDPNERMWDDYHDRKRGERLEEARQVWAALVDGGASQDTVLAVDFVHACPDRAGAEALQAQLSEHYTATLEADPSGYWQVRGTTRPYGVTLGEGSHADWVGFMCDVARSHGGMFVAWTLEAPSLGLTVSSEAFEAAG